MAIANADGSIVLTTKVDTSGVKQGMNEATRFARMSINEQRRLAQSLSGVYRKQGLTQSEAQKKAWKDLKDGTVAAEDYKKAIQDVKNETDKATKSTKKYGKQAQKSGETAKTAFSSVGAALKKLALAVAAAFSVQKIIQFSSEASNLATNTEASVQRLIDIYGSASDVVGDFIDENARALGMSKAAAASFSSVYGNLFSVWADQATNAELTNQYLQMTAVIASKTSRTIEDTQERIRSGLLGNTEAIEDLGIFVNIKTIEITDAFQRMANGKSWEQLDAYTQQQIRSMAILEQATAKYGTEVADTSATIRNRFKAAYQDFQNSWGTIINKILIPVLETLTEIFNVGTMIFNAFSGESGEILENAQLQEESAEKTSENIEEQVKSQKDLNKEMKKTLAGFDDIEILSSSDKEEDGFSLDIGSIFGESSPKETTKELSAFEKKIRKIVEKIKKAFEPLETSLKDFFVPLKDSANDVWNNVLIPFGDWVLNTFAPAFSQTLANGVTMAKDAFVELGEYLKTLWSDTLSPIFSGIGDFIIGLIKRTGELFAYISEKIGLHKEEIGMLIEFLGGLLQVVWELLKPLLDFALEMSESITKIIIDVVFTALSHLGNLYNLVKNIVLGIVELFKGNFNVAGEFFKNAFKSFGNIIINMANLVISLINTMLETTTGGIKAVINGLAGVIEKIGSWFGKDWNLKIDSVVPKIPQIPKLAQGTVVPPNKEFMAILGDNKKEHEIVSPLSTIEQAVANVLSRQGGATKEEHYYLNESELMRVVYKLFEGGKHLNGTSLEDGGY